LWFLVTQTDITKFFSASRDRGGGAWQNHGAAAAKSAA